MKITFNLLTQAHFSQNKFSALYTSLKCNLVFLLLKCELAFLQSTEKCTINRTRTILYICVQKSLSANDIFSLHCAQVTSKLKSNFKNQLKSTL